MERASIIDHIGRKACRYYYTTLNLTEKLIYQKICRAMVHGKESVQLDQLTSEQLKKIFNMILYDYPEIWDVIDADGYYNAQGLLLVIHYSEVMDRVEALKKIERMYAPYVKKAREMKQEERDLYWHDLLARRIRYHKTGALETHSIYSALLNNEAVCEGIAKAYKYLCDRSGVPCLLAVGTGGRNRGPHGWNMVYKNGDWYHVDVTFDLSNGSDCRHDYYLVSDGQTTYTKDPSLPVCKGMHDYYRNEGRYMEERSAFVRYMKEHPSDTFDFRMPEGIKNTSRMADVLAQLVLKEHPDHPVRVEVKVDPATKIVRVRTFADFQGKK